MEISVVENNFFVEKKKKSANGKVTSNQLTNLNVKYRIQNIHKNW